jgi:hypothetical protein
MLAYGAVPGMEETMLRISFAAVVAGFALLGASARADTEVMGTAGPSDSARYTFHRVQDYFLRLDVQTGQVSQCDWAASGWHCRVLPDERTALESEIDRLQDANLALKKELLSRGLPLPNGIKPDPQVSRRTNNIVRFPNDDEIERVSAYVGKVWRRMVEMMANLQRDVLRKS